MVINTDAVIVKLDTARQALAEADTMQKTKIENNSDPLLTSQAIDI